MEGCGEKVNSLFVHFCLRLLKLPSFGTPDVDKILWDTFQNFCFSAQNVGIASQNTPETIPKRFQNETKTKAKQPQHQMTPKTNPYHKLEDLVFWPGNLSCVNFIINGYGNVVSVWIRFFCLFEVVMIVVMSWIELMNWCNVRCRMNVCLVICEYFKVVSRVF